MTLSVFGCINLDGKHIHNSHLPMMSFSTPGFVRILLLNCVHEGIGPTVSFRDSNVISDGPLAHILTKCYEAMRWSRLVLLKNEINWAYFTINVSPSTVACVDQEMHRTDV